MGKNNSKRADSFRRGRAIRADATVGSAIKIIENDMGLPEGSVQLVLPRSLKRARSDKKLSALFKDWDYE